MSDARNPSQQLIRTCAAVQDDRFEEVVRTAEIERINERRKKLGEIARETASKPHPHILPGHWDKEASFNGEGNDLVGLAFSGGGIRSATFNLGVLQKLAELRLLPLVDYLSTVSGGGFIGGWWSSWMNRLTDKSQPDCGKWMPVSTDGPPAAYSEAPAIEYLRLYGNYLIPRKGLFSADT